MSDLSCCIRDAISKLIVVFDTCNVSRYDLVSGVSM